MPPGHKTQVADRYHPESGSVEEGWRQRADASIRLCTTVPPVVATQTSPVSSPIRSQVAFFSPIFIGILTINSKWVTFSRY